MSRTVRLLHVTKVGHQQPCGLQDIPSPEFEETLTSIIWVGTARYCMMKDCIAAHYYVLAKLQVFFQV